MKVHLKNPCSSGCPFFINLLHPKKTHGCNGALEYCEKCSISGCKFRVVPNLYHAWYPSQPDSTEKYIVHPSIHISATVYPICSKRWVSSGSLSAVQRWNWKQIVVVVIGGSWRIIPFSTWLIYYSWLLTTWQLG